MKLRCLQILVFTFFFCGSLNAQQTINLNEKIDEVLTKNVDITGDGVSDKIILYITGKSFKQPFSWTLEIYSKNKKIFTHKSDDTWLDAFFNDEGYVNDECRGYMECKRQYYYHDILDRLVIITDLSANPHSLKESNSGSIHYVARKHLKEKTNLADDEETKIIQAMIKKIKTGKTPLLYVPISAVQSDYPMMFVEDVGQFIRVYEW